MAYSCDEVAKCDVGVNQRTGQRGVRSGLYVIRQAGRPLYWNCSTEHGCGWNEGHPKQSFSKSELTREIFRMCEGNFTPIEIVELVL